MAESVAGPTSAMRDVNYPLADRLATVTVVVVPAIMLTLAVVSASRSPDRSAEA